MAKQADVATTEQGAKRAGRRGILAAAVLAMGALATRGTQPAAADTTDNFFFASGGHPLDGIAFENTYNGYLYGGSFTGDNAGVIGYNHGQYSGVIGSNDSATGFAGVSGITTGGNGYGVYGRSPNGKGNAGVYGENIFNATSIGVQGYTGSAGIGVLGGNTNGTGVYGTSSGGVGTEGFATTGIGVRGENHSSTNPAIYGIASGSTAGVRGDGNTGVQGVTTGGYGVYGSATSSGWGVYGESAANHAIVGSLTANASGKAGVWGGANGAGTYGVMGNGLGGAAGVLGKSSGNGSGVQGTNTTGIGVYGISGGGSFPYGVVGATTAPGFALYGVAGVANSVGFAAGAGVSGAIAGQFSGNVNFFGAGAAGNTVTLNGTNLVVANGGTKNAAVKVADGSFRLLHCVEAPEPWFEDFGKGTLTAGKAEMKLDPLFASTIDTSDLHVFLTPHDASHHLAVTATSGIGFSVTAGVSGDAAARGVKATDLNGTFTYRVVGKRKDVSGERLAKFDLPKEIKFASPPVPTTPPDSALPQPKSVSTPSQAQSTLPDMTPPMKPRDPGLPPSSANPMTKG